MSNKRAPSLAGNGAVAMLLTGLLTFSAPIWATPPEVAPGFVLPASRQIDIGIAVKALPTTTAGVPNSQRTESEIGGKRFVGRVRNLYARVASMVLLDVRQVPRHLIASDTDYFVDVEFPELLPNGTEAIRAQLFDPPNVQPGDIVEIKIAHKNNPRFFPVKEVTRVTQLVARSDTRLARNFARSITLARVDLSPLQAMLQTRAATGIFKP